MPKNRNPSPNIHRKLIRDRIPEIIHADGKTPMVREITGPELEDAVGMKILEEAHELFQAWKGASPDEC